MNTTSKDIFDAVEQNDLPAIRNFVEINGVNETLTNSFGQTAAHIAAKHGNLPIIRYLLSKNTSLIKVKDRWNQSVLHLAVQNGTLELVEYLVNTCNADILESDNSFTYTPCPHIAAAMGHVEVLKFFITEKKIDANLKNGSGQTCALSAAANNHFPVVKYLAEETNANLNLTDDSGQSILHLCASIGDLRIPKYLLDEKKLTFDVNRRDELGETILNRAATFSNYEFIKYFVDKKQAKIGIPNNEGRTLLHAACHSGDLKLVKFLVKKGADLESVDFEGHTPLQSTTDKKVLKYLEKVSNSTNSRERRFARAVANEWRSNSEKPLALFVHGPVFVNFLDNFTAFSVPELF